VPTPTSVAEALGKIGDARAVEPLIDVLKGCPWYESVMAGSVARALGQIGDARAVEPLIAALEDGKEHLRKAAAWALCQIGDARAVEPLIAALNDRDPGVRETAAAALHARAWSPDRGESGAAYWAATGEWDKCIQIGAPAVEPLIAALEDGNKNAREAAAEALGQIGDARAVLPLVTAIEDEDEDESVQLAAARALGILKDSGELEDLIARLKEQERICRELGDWAGLAISLSNQASLLEQTGREREALPLAEEAYRLAIQHDETALADRARAILDRLQ
jgi:HEAT repeat protein